MKIASWNINSIKVRTELVQIWLKSAGPDVLCLQETKVKDENFPAKAFEELGYNCAVHGQGGYNGVALLSRHPLEDVRRGLPGNSDDEQARYVEAVVSLPQGAVRVASIYLPNGNPAPGPKFDYKLEWMERLHAHANGLLQLEEPLVLAGDFNVIPEPDDVHDPKAWEGDALFMPESRAKFRELMFEGLTDAFRACHAEGQRYTFWDYQRGAWQKNHGIRIDHLLLSPQAADRLVTADIDTAPRTWEKPSDHTPIWCELDV
ncbi:MAG: exodeoxyribonuclease III [Alphaproteobacteria bacterium]